MCAPDFGNQKAAVTFRGVRYRKDLGRGRSVLCLADVGHPAVFLGTAPRAG